MLMMIRNKVAKFAALPVVAVLFAGNAMAEVPAGVTTALTAAQSDVGVIAAAVLLVFVAIFGFKVLKRAF